MTEIQRWEYKYETHSGGAFRAPSDQEIQDYLNELGEQGWEVIDFVQHPNTNKIAFAAKRPLIGTARHRHQFQEVG